MRSATSIFLIARFMRSSDALGANPVLNPVVELIEPPAAPPREPLEWSTVAARTIFRSPEVLVEGGGRTPIVGGLRTGWRVGTSAGGATSEGVAL